MYYLSAYSAAHKKIIWFPLETLLLSSQSWFFSHCTCHTHWPYTCSIHFLTITYVWPMSPVWTANRHESPESGDAYTVTSNRALANETGQSASEHPTFIPQALAVFLGLTRGLGLTKQCNLMEISPKLLATSSHHWGCHSHLVSVKPSTLYSAIYRPSFHLWTHSFYNFREIFILVYIKSLLTSRGQQIMPKSFRRN